MSEARFVPSMDPLLYSYAFNFHALASVHPEQYPVWLHSHAELLKSMAEKRNGYVSVGAYLSNLHTMDLYNAATWYRSRIDSTTGSFNWNVSSELTHVAMTHAAMVAHMEGATFQDDVQLSMAADRLYALLVFEAKTRANDFSNIILYAKATLDPEVLMTRYVVSKPDTY